MAVTLKEIAQKANCSVMAVSAVLNQGKGTRVSEQTRTRIRKIADDLGYLPNLAARSLGGGSSRLVGVIIDSEAPESCFKVLRYIEQTASRNGYRVMIAEQHNSMMDIAMLYRHLEQYGVDGVICLAHEYPGEREKSRSFFEKEKNFILYNMNEEFPFYSVIADPLDAYKDVLRQYRADGRRSAMLIAHSPENSVLQFRKNSYRRACEALNLEPLIFDQPYHTEPERILQANEASLENDILKNGVNGLLMQSDLYAAYMFTVLRSKRIRIPEDMAVTGWDNLDFSGALFPPLATIDNNYGVLGKRLFMMLADILGNRNISRIERVGAVYIHRESAGMKRAD